MTEQEKARLQQVIQAKGMGFFFSVNTQLQEAATPTSAPPAAAATTGTGLT